MARHLKYDTGKDWRRRRRQRETCDYLLWIYFTVYMLSVWPFPRT